MENALNPPKRGKNLRERASRMFTLWSNRMRYRRELAQLDARAIKDLGLTIEFVQWESSKFFWQK